MLRSQILYNINVSSYYIFPNSCSTYYFRNGIYGRPRCSQAYTEYKSTKRDFPLYSSFLFEKDPKTASFN